MEARLQETQLLHDLDKLLFTTTAPSEIPTRALALLQPVLRFEGAMLALRQQTLPLSTAAAEETLEGEFQVVARWRELPDILSALQLEKGRGLKGWRAMRARPLLISDTHDDPRATPELVQADVGSLMLVGLSSGTRLNGFLLMAHSQRGFFTTTDLETAQLIATHLTLLLERARLLHQLERLAVTDGLTGLYNYRHFHERYQEEVRRARRYGTPFAVMLLDMDNFKQVNDQYGHLEGDYVLVQLAELIRRAVRETELIARYGGDEFVLLLPTTNLQGARVAAERLLHAIRTHTFTTTGGEPLPKLTLSIGLAAYPDSSRNPAEILEKADDALETAKKTGRNRLESVVLLE
jgi:diguanylate cyclase (GGDEF)-like protein